MTSQHTQHGMPQAASSVEDSAKKSWLTEDAIFGLTVNGLIWILLFGIIILIFTRLNWDQIVTFW